MSILLKRTVSPVGELLIDLTSKTPPFDFAIDLYNFLRINPLRFCVVKTAGPKAVLISKEIEQLGPRLVELTNGHYSIGALAIINEALMKKIYCEVNPKSLLILQLNVGNGTFSGVHYIVEPPLKNGAAIQIKAPIIGESDQALARALVASVLYTDVLPSKYSKSFSNIAVYKL